MKIIKSGSHKLTHQIQCACGCLFEYDESDIYYDMVENSGFNVSRVNCPECNKKYMVTKVTYF